MSKDDFDNPELDAALAKLSLDDQERLLDKAIGWLEAEIDRLEGEQKKAELLN